MTTKYKNNQDKLRCLLLAIPAAYIKCLGYQMKYASTEKFQCMHQGKLCVIGFWELILFHVSLNLLTRKSRCPPCTVSSIDYDDIVFVTKNDGTTRGIPRITRDVCRTIQQIHRAELYVIKVWSRMLSAVFDDSSKRTFSMW